LLFCGPWGCFQNGDTLYTNVNGAVGHIRRAMAKNNEAKQTDGLPAGAPSDLRDTGNDRAARANSLTAKLKSAGATPPPLPTPPPPQVSPQSTPPSPQRQTLQGSAPEGPTSQGHASQRQASETKDEAKSPGGSAAVRAAQAARSAGSGTTPSAFATPPGRIPPLPTEATGATPPTTQAAASGGAAAAHKPANVDVARLWADASQRADKADGKQTPKDWTERDAAKPSGVGTARDTVGLPQPPRIDTAGADDAVNGAQAERPQTDTQARDRDDPQTTIDNPRRRAKRRPAGAVPPANMATDLAANDDGPSIGGLLYSLNRKPSNKPFYIAAVASAAWLISGIVFGYLVLAPDIARVTSFADFVRESTFMTTLASVVGPVLLFWFLAFLAWRSEELHLRSTAMTEVAVRLAEPDRMAEEQVASLGQAVRRQVTFMNDAVNHALSRAGELEAMVQGEVTALERSYEDNEKKIRSLLQELAQERHSLTGTGEHFKGTLETLAKDVPLLIEQLSTQQGKLAGIIAGAGENLTALEMSLAQQTGRLETSLDDRTQMLQSTLGDRAAELQTVLESYAEAISTTFQGRSEGLQVMLSDERAGFEQSLTSGQEGIQNLLADQRTGIEQSLTAGQEGIQNVLTDQRAGIEQSLRDGHQSLNTVLTDQRQDIEETLTREVARLGTKLDSHRDAVETTLGGYTDALGTILHDRSAKIEQAIAEHNAAVERHGHQIDSRLTARQADLGRMLEDHRASLEANLNQHNAAVERHGADIDSRLTARQADLGRMLEDHRAGLEANLDQQTGAIDDIITKRTEFLQSVFDEYALALDTTLANRANALDTQLVERTKALDEAFTDRLRLFDESIVRSTQAIDDAVGENAKSLTAAMEAHAESLSDMIRTQSVELDETLVRGIGAVRESSENISRQSIRAIEGLATARSIPSQIGSKTRATRFFVRPMRSRAPTTRSTRRLASAPKSSIALSTACRRRRANWARWSTATPQRWRVPSPMRMSAPDC